MSNRLHELEGELYAAREAAAMATAVEYAEEQVRVLTTRLRICDPDELRHIQGQVLAHQNFLTAVAKPPFEL